MTAPTQSPLVGRVAEALAEHDRCRLCEGSDRHCNHHRELAQKALDACHAEEMRQVIELLVYAKKMKDREGDSPAYRAKKEEGWTHARALLAKLYHGSSSISGPDNTNNYSAWGQKP
jgi:hypothetical protein